MILTAFQDQDFKEEFTFKSETGVPVVPPVGNYRLILEHGGFAREYSNLSRTRTGLVWIIPSAEVTALPYRTLYFTLNFNGGEITRGVLRVE